VAALAVDFGVGMEEALARLERGDDPEKIEEEMGDLLDSDELFKFIEKGVKKPKPRVDDTIYDL
jgi:hypothetical protein